jgi:hypothetical protein
MIDFDRPYEMAGHEPDGDDLRKDKRLKLIVLGIMAVAIGMAIYMDVTGQVGSWK